MPQPTNEPVVRVPPLKKVDIEAFAGELREVLGGSTHQAGPLDWPHLVDVVLPSMGVDVYPVRDSELPDRHAVTDHLGTGPIRILVRQDVYDSLWDRGRRGNQGRATIAHELGHALLHVPFMRQMAKFGCESLLLNRVVRGPIKAYESSEWQAWTLARFLLMPRAALVATLEHHSLLETADAFGASVAMLKVHMHRLGMEVPND